MKHSMLRGIAVAVVLFLALGSLFCLAEEADSTATEVSQDEENYIQVDDELPDLPIVDMGGNEHSLRDLIGEKYTLMIYARSTCKDCQAYFKEYSELLTDVDNDYYAAYIVWDDNVSEDTLEINHFSAERCYSTRRQYRLNNWVPTYYIIDPDGKIVFKTEDYEDLSQKLTDMCSEEE